VVDWSWSQTGHAIWRKTVRDDPSLDLSRESRENAGRMGEASRRQPASQVSVFYCDNHRRDICLGSNCALIGDRADQTVCAFTPTVNHRLLQSKTESQTMEELAVLGNADAQSEADERERFRKQWREKYRRQKAAKPERFIRKWRANRERRRKRDPDGVKRLSREGHARRYRNDPEKVRAQWRANTRRYKAKKSRERGQDLLAATLACLPRALPGHMRDDIASEMMLAVLSRKISREALAAEAPSFIRVYWKANSRFDTMSLDAPIGQGTLTLTDVLSSKPWDSD
jgi:hypothetical protein